MPLGTLDRTPPPFFRQGPSAFTRLVFFSALALFLMVADRRFAVVEPVRAALATALLPVQRVLAVPVALGEGGIDYLQGLEAAREAERRAREQLAGQATQAARTATLEAENTRLRALLELAPALPVRALAAEFMYEAADPYSRKFYINRGGTHGVLAGSPVVNEAGVIGQVTRVHPLSAEVTQLADKDAAIPVLNSRTRQRAAAYGGASGATMELRFTSANADVQVGDLLVTGGVDGVYPPGLPVGRVSSVERRAESGFARILLEPAAPADDVRHVLVLEPLQSQWPAPPPAASATAPAEPEPARRGPGARRAPAGSGR